MKRFTQLYFELDATTRTNEKLDALERYFRGAPDDDAAWALFFLTGKTVPRGASTNLMRMWISEEAFLPLWLVEECYDAVGDLGEALALLAPYPAEGSGSDEGLTSMINTRLLPLRQLDDAAKRSMLIDTWRMLDTQERLVWNKLITGSFRVGVARTLLERALARIAGVPQSILAHRLMGGLEPTSDAYRSLLAGAVTADIGQPYPFALAYPLDSPPDVLGGVEDWQIEWKWDGIRAQVIRRAGKTLVWSRGEERVTDGMPEIAAIGSALADGTVLDGEILAWKDGAPLPFAKLQTRLNRKTVGAKLLNDAPVAFVAFDIAEFGGEDIRQYPLCERRALLERTVADVQQAVPALQISEVALPRDWNDAAVLRERAREKQSEGLMLKRKDSVYGVGRLRGDWWKWKIAPYSIDAVMIYAQSGHGRRASVYSDYTFGVWDEGKLVPVAKAYSGLTDAEMRDVDRFVRQHTLEKHGPVRIVEPKLVFELAFEGIQVSTRHKCGIAVRFPRIARLRPDKTTAEADTIESLRALLADTAPRTGD